MTHRSRLAGLLVATTIVLGGCAAAATPSASVAPSASSSPVVASPPVVSPSPSPSLSPSPSPSPVPSSPVAGVVIRVDSEGLTDVRSFTIRTDDGTVLVFRVDRLEAGSLPVGHLTEHAATGAPVRVTFVFEDGELVAVSYADAD